MTRTLLAAALLATVLALPAGAPRAATPQAAANAAADALKDAADQLATAETRDDRIGALTATVAAYESGLAAIRDALRAAAIEERRLAGELTTQETDLGRILGVLMAVERTPETTMLLHPAGALATVRTALVAADVAPALRARTDQLTSRLEDLAVIRALREDAERRLTDGLTGIETARERLSAAISRRTDLPEPVATDEAAMIALLEAADTLGAFAASLTGTEAGDSGAFDTARGALPLPVSGRLLRAPGEPDAAGIRRPGILIAARPSALVTSPAPATVRYAGPLLDYGNVIILEPQNGYLLVLAGLGETYARRGQIVTAGEALGLMPSGASGPAEDASRGNSADTALGHGQEVTETLYMELREQNDPVDPTAWFRLDRG